MVALCRLVCTRGDAGGILRGKSRFRDTGLRDGGKMRGNAWSASNAVINESGIRHLPRVVKIPSINDGRVLQERLEPGKIQGCKFLPFGQNQQSVATGGGIVGILGVEDAILGQNFFGVSGGRGVVYAHLGAFVEESFDNSDRWCLANVVGIALKSQPEHA